MPRPSSKLMASPAAAEVQPTAMPQAAAATDDLATAAPAKRVFKPRKVPQLIAVLSKAERKAKAEEFKQALKAARQPLDEVEAKIRATSKVKTEQAKVLAAAQKAHDKAVKAADKELAGHETKRVKFQAAHDKAVAKISKQMEELKK